MLVMRTIEDSADPLGKLVSSQKTVRFDDLALAVYPLRLDGVEPRTLLRQQAAHDPYSTAALFDFSVVLAEPAPDLLGDVPGSVVPDENHYLLSGHFELFDAPRKKARRYGTDGPPIHEPQPCLLEPRHIEPLTGDGLRIGIVFSDRLLDEAQWIAFLGEATQGGQGYPAPPALVTETHRPGLGVGCSYLHQSVASEASLFFFRRGDRGR
jgi:hypothetical protein